MRAVLKKLTKTESGQVEVLQDQLIDDVEFFKNFGFDCKIESGRAILTGSADEPIMLAINKADPDKISLKDNEVLLYNSKENYILLDNGFEIIIKSKKIKLDGDTEVDGDLTVDGDFEINGDVKFTGNTSFTGDVEILGSLDMTGSVEILGNLDVTGNVEITGSLTVNGVNFSTHAHSYINAGVPAVTGVPQ